MILNSSSKKNVERVHGSEDEEERVEGSLVCKPRARRRIISDDEVTPPPSSVPVDEPESVILMSSNEEMNVAPRDSTDQLFSLGFDNEDFGLVYEEAPLVSFPMSVPIDSQVSAHVIAAIAPPMAVFTFSTVPIDTTSRVEVGSSSSNRIMKEDTIEVSKDGNILKKSGQVNVLLKPVIPQLRSLSWKATINLIGTEIRKRIIHTEQLQLSKATKEIKGLKELLNQKEIYVGELVQTLTQAQEDLRASSYNVQFLERSLAPLKASYDASLIERETLKAEIEQWERDYEPLEDKSTLDVSWAFLNMRIETLIEASQEGFDLTAEIAKAKETIEKTQQSQNFSSPEVDVSEGDELTPREVGVQASSAQVVSSPDTDDALLDSASLDADSTALDPAS
uniref:Uncharacterized protein LOC104213816 n=1 Tax=Nicotiana sylvestris TaxID=4096 RepID=A0A1U7VII6_NICSY|nr:PREDICTED: uncharacterized protein LOC104213816 [Nicotiana sylvestris]